MKSSTFCSIGGVSCGEDISVNILFDFKLCGEDEERGVKSKSSFCCGQVVFIGILLCLLQVLDGVFTFIGVSRFGLEIEGNPLVRFLMESFGYATALAGIKGIATLIVLFLIYLAKEISWMNKALSAVSVVYVLTAILPWTYILFFKPIL